MPPTLLQLLETFVADGGVPGATALVARGKEVEVATAGELSEDSIVRIGSVTKPITAAALMLLVDDGLVSLDDPIARWLPELANPLVVRTPQSRLDDVVPLARPITVEDVLTSRAGWGFPSDLSLPAVVELLQALPAFGAQESPNEWLRTLAGVPLLSQPGEAWLDNTCSDIQGVLIARISGHSFPHFLSERIFQPLGMVDTGFHVPPERRHRLARYHGSVRPVIDEMLWRAPPIFPSGATGLVSTVADWYRFGQMLLADGAGLLAPNSVRLMTTDHLSPMQRSASSRLLAGSGWGYGGAVEPDGRYGWFGDTGTTAHIEPAVGTIAILLTQLQMTSPAPTPLMRDFWRFAFARGPRER
jgi:CubicO group peptidase (beta-lactamase class C family)